jgi:hypothetical protein
VVEVDETYMGGEEPGLRGGRARGKKLLVGIAVEPRQSHGLGRCRMAVLPDAKTDTLRAFLADHVEESATVMTDGWQPYRQATAGRYVHQRQPGAGRKATTTLPGVHRVALLAKAVAAGHPPGLRGRRPPASYHDEFVFRFNRRRARSRVLVFYRVLELAVAHQPVRYRDLMLNPRTPTGPRQPPGTRGKPPTLDRPPARRPWRTTDQHNSGYRCLTVEVTRWTQSRAGSYRSETPRATAWRTPPLSAAVRNIRS